MKKIACLLLNLLILFTLTACNNQKEVEPTQTPKIILAPTGASEIINDSTFAVHYIDVGQADSALILCDGQSMLIDGGNVADSSLIVAYLKKQNIDTLDYIVCSHGHEDHVGGLSAALSTMTVKNVYAPKTEANSKAYTNFKTKAKNQGLDIIHPTTGDTVNVGSASVEFFTPTTESANELNNTSIMCRIDYGSTSFLFTGDAERDEEQDIISQGCNLDADVLKVGHHGSDTSTSYVFLREVMPEYAIISVGKDNSYGHPTETVLSRLRDADVKLYRTDLQGDIIATSDGSTVSITTSRNENAQTNETVAKNDNPEAEYIGNMNSKKFHRPDCRTLPTEHNRIYFSSRSEAVNAGYSRCGNCLP